MSFQEHDRARESISGVGRRQAAWSAIIGLAIVVALFGVFYDIYAHDNANPPDVLSAPSPATGVIAPAPKTTTGRGASRQDTKPAAR